MEAVRVCVSLDEDFIHEILDDKKLNFTNKIVDETGKRFLGSLLFASELSKIPVPKGLKQKSTPSLVVTAKKAKVCASPISMVTTSPIVVKSSTGSATKIDISSMMTIMQNMSTNEKVYKCSFCGEEIKAQGNMRRHIETKHLPSPDFKCLNCDYNSKQKPNLKRHYMAKHGMLEPAVQGMLLIL